ncbi:MAG: enoyl-CoA hydratase [Thermodesulfobacteriota bacterium]|nr:enoyl-CoA hydratase [Thermodesulfobacteriota bacterium]
MKTLLLDKKAGVFTIRLNRPDVKNAFDAVMRAELIDAFDMAREDDAVRVVLLTGEGEAFCAGADVKGMDTQSPDEGEQRLSKSHVLLRKMVYLEKPIIAAVNGVAAGNGCSFVLASDLAIASENATFINVFIRIGIVPDFGGMFFLPRLVGLAKSKELVFFGDRISALEAERIGMINRVVPHEILEEEARKWAGRLAESPTRAIGISKMIMNRSWNLDLETALEEELQAQFKCSQTLDHKEGILALKEKRKPKFAGK